MQQQTFTSELINQRQHSKPAAIAQAGLNEIHAPTLVRSCGCHLQDPYATGEFLPLLGAHNQPFFGV